MSATSSPPPSTPSTTARTPTDDEWDSDADDFTLAGYEPQEQQPDGAKTEPLKPLQPLEHLEHLEHLDRTSWCQRGFEMSTGKVVKQITRGFSIKFIAVMGLSGTGKSSLIRRLTGCDVFIGDNLEAGTTTFAMYASTIDSQRYIFIDTPGFDDAKMDDQEVFNEIMKWFRTMTPYVTLSGILYLHPVTDVRLRGNAGLNLRFLKELAGEEFYKNVTFVTTMWDGLTDNRRVKAEQTELQLQEKPWKDFIDTGADVARFVDAVSDLPGDIEQAEIRARSIVTRFKTAEKVRPRIQLELKQRVPIGSTRAARVLAGEFGEPDLEDERDATRVSEEARQTTVTESQKQGTNLNVTDLHIYAENLHITNPAIPSPLCPQTPKVEIVAYPTPPPPPPSPPLQPKKSWWQSLVKAIRSFFPW